MQSHGTLEIFPRHMLKWTDFDNASVVDQDVHLAKAVDDLPNNRLNLPGIQQVACTVRTAPPRRARSAFARPSSSPSRAMSATFPPAAQICRASTRPS